MLVSQHQVLLFCPGDAMHAARMFYIQTKKDYRSRDSLFYTINCIFFFLLLQIFSYVLRLVSRNVLFYESPAGYLLLRSFS